MTEISHVLRQDKHVKNSLDLTEYSGPDLRFAARAAALMP